jgi:cytochrome c5
MPNHPIFELIFPSTNQTWSARVARWFAKKNQEPLGANRVVTQTMQDLFGTKDVQDAIMASYVWMADQIGHIALGAIFTLLWCWGVYAFTSPGTTRSVLYIGGTLAVFAVWFWKERVDLRDVTVRASGSQFDFNISDVQWNVHTALFYFLLGGLLAMTPFFGLYAFLATIILWVPAVFLAYWWLRRKIAFQQAGLPYLFRVANFKGELSDAQKAAIRHIAGIPEKPDRVHVHEVLFFWLSRSIREQIRQRETHLLKDPLTPQHLVISGPLASGKTPLATGIGTEYAFALGIGRYISAIKLLELAQTQPNNNYRIEPEDGRILWPWRGCDLLIVDDVDAAVKIPWGNDNAAIDGAAAGQPQNVDAPQAFRNALIQILGGKHPLDWLRNRRSVWVVGDPQRADVWTAIIAELMGIDRAEEIMSIRLQGILPKWPEQVTPVPAGEPRLARALGKALAGFGGLFLLLSATWWWREGEWGRFQQLSPEQAFAGGSFGLELAPLKYFLVMPQLSAKPMGIENSPDVAKRFGFAARADASAGKCVADAPQNLPVGFSVSNRMVSTASPVPVKFVGLTCAACHATQVGSLKPFLGAATQTADLIGFSDALSSAILDNKLTADAILSAYDKQCPTRDTPAVTGIGPLDRIVESYLIGAWLDGSREAMRKNAAKYDMAFSGHGLFKPDNIPTGPSRSRPFRSVIRNVLDLPGETNHAISKMPAVFMQAYKNWAQYDGSIGNPEARSAVAIFASGATLPAMNERQIADNIRQAAKFTLRVGEDPKVPTLAEAFPESNPPGTDVSKGEQLYMQNCYSCHGGPQGTGWKMPEGKDDPDITRLDVIKTDPARINFRYVEMLAPALTSLFPSRDDSAKRQMLEDLANKKQEAGATAEADFWRRFIDSKAESAKVNADISDFAHRSREFPAGHRLADAFAIGQVVRREGNALGYQNIPIPRVWLRAPYLHNGSIPTLRALLVPSERPNKFCRGNGGYDTKAIGIPVVLPDADGCKAPTQFLFDAAVEGNSNQGHEISIRPQDVDDLLAYLRTL